MAGQQLIAGPILPRTREGLSNIVQDDPTRLETGLCLHGADLVLDGGVTVDFFARDAVGAPVLVFLSVLHEDWALAGRVAEARATFARMRPAFAGPVVGGDRPVRAIVIGFDFAEGALSRLRESAWPWLRVLRVDGFLLDGALHLAVTPVVEPEARPIAPFAVPETWPLGAQRAIASTFVDLLRRLDPELRVDGDGFARRYSSANGIVVELSCVDRHVVATVPGVGSLAVRSDDDCVAVFDRVMRRHLDLAGEVPTARPSTPTDQRPTGHDVPFAELRRRLVESELSPQEFDAFHAIDSEP